MFWRLHLHHITLNLLNYKKLLKNLNGLTLNEIIRRIKSNLSLYMLIGGHVHARR